MNPPTPAPVPTTPSSCLFGPTGAIWNESRGEDIYGVRIPQGGDYLALPPRGSPTVWTAGSTVEVAFAMSVNHGGGYVYRLCPFNASTSPTNGGVTEACFQQNVLSFAGDSQWIRFANGTRIEIPMTKVREGTHPSGSVWARNPVPECLPCSAKASTSTSSSNGSRFDATNTYQACGKPLVPVPYVVCVYTQCVRGLCADEHSEQSGRTTASARIIHLRSFFSAPLLLLCTPPPHVQVYRTSRRSTVSNVRS